MEKCLLKIKNKCIDHIIRNYSYLNSLIEGKVIGRMTSGMHRKQFIKQITEDV